MGGETCNGECVRVVLLDPRCHLFPNQAPQVEVFAGVAGAHETAQFHGAVGKVGDLQTADPFVPQRRGVDDRLELPSQVLHWNRVVEVEKRSAHDVGGLACPVLKGVFDEVTEGDDEPAEVPYSDDDVGRVDLFNAAPFSLDYDDVIDADRFGDGNLEAGEEVSGGGFGGGGQDQ
jgi:hypothetical protein